MINTIKTSAVNLFIITYVFVLAWWLIYPCPLRTAILQPVSQHVMYWGLWQGWGVFSPNISRNCVNVTANLLYDDGTTKTWEFPRPETYGYVDQMYLERWRKFGYDHASRPNYAYLHPDFARWIARLNAQQGKKVVQVDLYRHVQKLLPYTAKSKGERGPLKSAKYFSYRLKPEEQK
jgi:hypothetical protein